MHTEVSRRAVLAAGSQLVVVGAAFGRAGMGGGFRAGQPAGDQSAGKPARMSNGKARPEINLKNVPDKGPAIDKTLVFEFVYFAHSSIETVQDMLADTPALVNAAWDWGGGDWETALGGAGHMGRRDIAAILIEAGARVELPVACMLGQLEFVKAALAAFPRAARTPGPHGIPLIAHAKRGGEEAKGVLDYLESLEVGKGK